MLRVHHLRAAAMLAAAIWPLTALADTIHVAPCGDDAWTGASALCAGPDGPKATIQAAIDAAVAGDTVLIADGTYTGPGNRSMDFGGKAITLRSASGAAASIIDLQGSAADPARAFHFHSGETADSIVEGLTIRNGFMNRGGAVMCEDSSPQFRGCVFERNTAWSVTIDDGGGAVYNIRSSPVFIDCRFVGNHVEANAPLATNAPRGGAVLNELRSSPTFTDCRFEQNTASGPELGAAGAIANNDRCHILLTRCAFVANSADAVGAIVAVDSSVVAHDCEFRENTATEVNAGGVQVSLESHGEFVDCRFIGNFGFNSAGAAQVSAPGATGAFTNCLFAENRTSVLGGAALVVVAEGEATLVNCTLTRNESQTDGVIVAVNSGRAEVRNSVLWDNVGEPITAILDGVADVRHTNIQGGWAGPGIGNIDADPLWLDPATGDFRLGAGSPSIDAGDNSAVPAGITTDLAGLPRFVNDPATPPTGVPGGPGGDRIVDMGAYEYQGCYADCDASGALDFFDFLCFQNLFAAGDPTADCDASGHLDFFDFLCFQNQFAAGCP